MLANRLQLKVHSVRIQSTECPNPFPFMFFTSSSSLNITSWNLLNDHDGEVFHGMSTPIEVLSHRFLNLLVFDVRPVAIEAEMQGILCWTYVLLLALFALYDIHTTLGLAVSRCAHLEGLSGHRASKRVGRLEVSTSLAPSTVTWPVFILRFPGTFSDGKRSSCLRTCLNY